ncbi:hypothetical protein GPJ56_006111 [Histomonas meleagridis]|uniref:uncharacterized protein n=1 Tax=Histomonas meleagridis TaxID=135588 RepID=UPI003559E74A|nr:hypothetical protein GPJ56_006111 [Histomonas meleagridis]KAH0804037.1 hypothetical protein GO595_002867 [Histomonas meleagridis]
MSSDSDLGILRQLLHREQAFFDIEQQQAKSFEKDSYNSIKNLIFQTRKVYSLHLSVLEQHQTGTPRDIPDLMTMSNNLPHGFSAIHQRTFQTMTASLLGDPKKFAELLSKYIDENPESENLIVFSLIPALFSCLWSQEEATRFVELLLSFDPKYYPSFTRLLIVHPSFFVFLSSIQSEANRLLNSDDLSFSSIIALLQSITFLFPSSIHYLLSKVPDPTKFFYDCILEPLLKNPALYGLVPSSETRTFSSLCENPDMEQVASLVDILVKQTNTIQMQPVESSLSSVLSGKEQLIYLLRDDCKILKLITNSDVVPPEDDGVYQVPFKRSIPQPTVTKTDSTDDSDPFEALLRTLVIQLDVAHAGKDIIDTLDAALMLHAGASRLKFELRLDEFKQMKKQKNAPDDVSYYVQLLTSAYEQRMKHRKATLSNSTTSDVFKVQNLQSSQAVNFLLRTRQMAFFNTWCDTGVFDNIESQYSELCTNNKTFSQTYKSLITSFIQFAEEKKFSTTKDQYVPIVYNRLTQKITLSLFRSYHPELVKLDDDIHNMIENHRDFLYSRNSLPFLQAFKDDPQLMGLSAQHLERAFLEDSVIPIAEWIDRALTALIHVLSFQGYKEIGADHWLPMTLILFIHVNPPKIASVAAYMHHCLLTLTDNTPISQSIEYNMTMTHSASEYFKNELQKMNSGTE